MSNRQEKERRRQARQQAEAQAAAAVQRRSTIRLVAGVAVALAAAVALVIVGTNSKSSGSDSGPSLTSVPARPAAASTSASTRGPRSPAARSAVAGLRAQANQVIDEMCSAAGKAQGRAGRGQHVGVMVSELPCGVRLLPELSKAYDGKVAFLGLDSNDNRGDAESFLKQFPIPYPSISDPGAD